MRRLSLPTSIRVLILLPLVFSLACASLGVKQKASLTHQTTHSALIALDDFELQLCAPAPAAPNTCTNPLRIISDAQHQAFSRLMVQAYDADIKVGRAIIAWVPGAPVPTNVAELRGYLEQARPIIQALSSSPKTVEFFDLLDAALKTVDGISAAFIKGTLLQLEHEDATAYRPAPWEVSWTR